MKTLCKEHMNYIAGAGGSLEGTQFDYRTYDNFDRFVGQMKKLGVDALKLDVPGVREAFISFCDENNYDVAGSAKLNGFTF